MAPSGRIVITLSTADSSQYIHPHRGFLVEVRFCEQPSSQTLPPSRWFQWAAPPRSHPPLDQPIFCSTTRPTPPISAGQDTSYYLSITLIITLIVTITLPRSGHLFPSLQPTATLLCTGHSYHSPLPTCLSISSLLSSSNTTVVQALLAKNSTRELATRTPHITTVWLQEVLLPLVLTVSTLVLSLTGLILLLLMKRHMATEANNLHSQHCAREPTRDTLVVSTLDMRNPHTFESNHLF